MGEGDWHPEAHPGHYFSRISRALTRIGDARFRGLGFATAQLPVLAELKGGASRSQTELARRVKVEQPTMAQLLARMERDGLIRRAPDPTDRRSSLISLTEAAEERLPAGQAILRQANREMTAGMAEEEVATLVDLLRRVLANVEAMDRNEGAGAARDGGARQRA